MKLQLGVVAFVGLTITQAPRLADACGGCFAPTDTVTSVDAHRMVIALSPERTVLWDQIKYTGNPADFVWVLPVPSSDAVVALAEDSFFARLEAQTAPRVQPLRPPTPLFCPDEGGGGFGCGGGAYDGDDDATQGAADAGVQVFNQSVVGPYETVTIGSEDAGALQTWLGEHGYAVPVATRPTLMHYIDQKSVFIVLRLRPGAGVQAMQPVRVTFPGYMATFPLKMVTVGASAVLELTLWVIADQRYDAGNYGTLTIDPKDVTWDWGSNRSDYDTVFRATIEQGGGRAWIAEYAGPEGTLAAVAPPFGSGLGESPDATAARGTLRVPYVTRLRTRLLPEHLSKDLMLMPSPLSANIDAVLLAEREINRPAQPDCNRNQGCRLGLGRRAGAAAGPLLLLVAVVMVLRRRKPARG
ncbi:MAG: DUF2330 domain-containing protein [Deltaproteobacteria bacterium]|nr:DUF2330 domain-containing protein [Deltaproteobacteria bacterium]